MTISPNGLIQLTSRIFKPVGNAIEENGIEKTYFDSLLFKKLRAGEINGCSKCEFFKRCRGDRNVSYTICGDFFGPDEHCWHWQEHVRARQLQ
jgi:MoaA/NifB/PqqE/SkfB family radical SAM enzyme